MNKRPRRDEPEPPSTPIDFYSGNPAIRAIVRLIPGGLGSAADVLIMAAHEEMREARLRAFFDELAAGKTKLTRELIESHDFLHSFDATLRAALRARRLEKTRLFARLLQRGAVENGTDSPDDYEELVGILDELSYREWQALLLFEQHLGPADANQNSLQRVQPIWEAFTNDLEEMLGVPRVEASSFMVRIARTGLFNEITGAYLDYGGGLGMLTPKFARFKALIEERNDGPSK